MGGFLVFGLVFPGTCTAHPAARRKTMQVLGDLLDGSKAGAKQ
jgi:hypothetical protein